MGKAVRDEWYAKGRNEAGTGRDVIERDSNQYEGRERDGTGLNGRGNNVTGCSMAVRNKTQWEWEYGTRLNGAEPNRTGRKGTRRIGTGLRGTRRDEIGRDEMVRDHEGRGSTAIEGRGSTHVEGTVLSGGGRNWAGLAGRDGNRWDRTNYGGAGWNTTGRDSTGLDG